MGKLKVNSRVEKNLKNQTKISSFFKTSPKQDLSRVSSQYHIEGKAAPKQFATESVIAENSDSDIEIIDITPVKYVIKPNSILKSHLSETKNFSGLPNSLLNLDIDRDKSKSDKLLSIGNSQKSCLSINDHVASCSKNRIDIFKVVENSKSIIYEIIGEISERNKSEKSLKIDVKKFSKDNLNKLKRAAEDKTGFSPDSKRISENSDRFEFDKKDKPHHVSNILSRIESKSSDNEIVDCEISKDHLDIKTFSSNSFAPTSYIINDAIVEGKSSNSESTTTQGKSSNSRSGFSDVDKFGEDDCFDDDLDFMLADDFDKMSPFKMDKSVSQECIPDWVEKKIKSEKTCVKSFAEEKNFGRHLVINVKCEVYKREMILTVKQTSSNIVRKCILSGFWYDTLIREGDIINILFADESNGCFKISNDRGLIVVNPDFLVSGTSVVSGVFCSRKSVLNEKFKGLDGKNRIMIIGILVHQLFQQVLRESIFDEHVLIPIIDNMLNQPSVVKELYSIGMAKQEMLIEVKKFIPFIKAWTKKYLKICSNADTVTAKGEWNGSITAIHDIEENIWSPRYGVKGKIDLTVEIENKDGRKEIVPLELKTGKASQAVEHKGQVTLYSMMSGDRRLDPQKGLLLYLRDGSMYEISAGEKEKKGLIQLRNTIVSHLHNNRSRNEKESMFLPTLPEPLNSERLCCKCAQLMTCTALQRIDCTDSNGNVMNDYLPSAKMSNDAMSRLVPETTKYLSQESLNYFRQWYLWLNLERSESLTSQKKIWCMSGKERELHGDCFSEMELQLESEIIDPHSSYYPHHFKKKDGVKLLKSNIQCGDSIVVSTKCEVVISQGNITKIYDDSIKLILDRSLHLYPNWDKKVYRIDKCEYQNVMGINFTNIAELMSDNNRAKRLRELIVERSPPLFEIALRKDIVVKLRPILQHLNRQQQRVILKTILAKDYVILKGFPGTGKTSSIVGLVRSLNSLNKTVLVTSYTHSALDNILLKLKEYNQVDFMRLGRISRIHSSILPYSEEILTKYIDSVENLTEFYNSKNVVATTCLSSNHLIFQRRKFDFCIVDEASQVLQTTCLGPLLNCSVFVLVGDSKQLPPVIKSKIARTLGMEKSLFEHLDNTNATLSLSVQFRMNSVIMALANHLTYEGQLECASKELETKTIKFTNLVKVKSWLEKCTSTLLSDSVVIYDTCDGTMQERTSTGSIINKQEAYIILKMILQLVELGISTDEIGVITPYREQVLTIRESLPEFCSGVEVNTVDQYQGRDKSVILYSCVRSVEQDEQVRSDEILNDVRRLNVAITRAKHKLIILGDTQSLRQFVPFKKILQFLNTQQIYCLSPGKDEFSFDD